METSDLKKQLYAYIDMIEDETKLEMLCEVDEVQMLWVIGGASGGIFSTQVRHTI